MTDLSKVVWSVVLQTQQVIMPSLNLWRLVKMVGASSSLDEGCLVAVSEAADALTIFTF